MKRKRENKDRVISSLYDIQAGDKVLLVTKYMTEVIEVTRTTGDFIFCGTRKFAKYDGHEVPIRLYRLSNIELLTEENKRLLEESIERDKCAAAIAKADWDLLSTESLKKIYDILVEEEAIISF